MIFSLLKEAAELTSIFIASRKTAQSKIKNQKSKIFNTINEEAY